MLHRYTHNIIQYHKWIIFISLIFAVALGTGAKKLTTTSDFNIYFSDDNPQLAAFTTILDSKIYKKAAKKIS